MSTPAMLLVCPKCGSVYTHEVEFCGIDGAKLIETENDPLIGREIDRLTITDLVGQGGMARVYLAKHRHLDRQAAIKVLLGDLAADRSLVRRFEREAVALSKLHHPNIVEVTDFGRSEDGLVFIVMEYLHGSSLIDVLKSEAVLSPQRAASIARQTALALETAHAQGFVHRDLKPGNIMLVPKDGEDLVKILDFGIVGIVEGSGMEATELTLKGQFVGTPAYMSPEQVSGKKVGPASDLYSLGVILYRMVVGELPFTGELVELAHAHVKSPPPPPPADTGELGKLALALLEKKIDDRPASAREVVDRIEQMMGLSSRLPSRVPEAAAAKRESKSEQFSMEIDLSEERDPRTVNMRSEAAFAEISGVGDELDEYSIKAALGNRGATRGLFVLALMLGLLAVAVVKDYFGLGTRARPYIEQAQSLMFGTSTAEPSPPSTVGGPAVHAPPKRPAPKASIVKPDEVKSLGSEPESEPSAAEAKASPKESSVGGEPKPPRPNPGTKTNPADLDAAMDRIQVSESDSASGSAGVTRDQLLAWDKQLRSSMRDKGLTWDDVRSIDPERVKTWTLWMAQTGLPDTVDGDAAFEDLTIAIANASGDAKVLRAKLRRLRSVLDHMAKGPAYKAFDQRYVEINRGLAFGPTSREVRVLMKDAGDLEAEMAASR